LQKLHCAFSVPVVTRVDAPFDQHPANRGPVLLPLVNVLRLLEELERLAEAALVRAQRAGQLGNASGEKWIVSAAAEELLGTRQGSVGASQIIAHAQCVSQLRPGPCLKVVEGRSAAARRVQAGSHRHGETSSTSHALGIVKSQGCTPPHQFLTHGPCRKPFLERCRQIGEPISRAQALAEDRC
jgi:hypothetical protein